MPLALKRRAGVIPRATSDVWYVGQWPCLPALSAVGLENAAPFDKGSTSEISFLRELVSARNVRLHKSPSITRRIRGLLQIRPHHAELFLEVWTKPLKELRPVTLPLFQTFQNFRHDVR